MKLFEIAFIAAVVLGLLRCPVFLAYMGHNFLEVLTSTTENYTELLIECIFPGIKKNTHGSERLRKILNLMSVLYWIAVTVASLTLFYIVVMKAGND